MTRSSGSPLWAPKSATQVILHGIIGGIAGGITLIVSETLMFWLQGLPIFAPARAIAAIALGEAAVIPDFPIERILMAFLFVHTGLSIFWGLVFAFLVSSVRSVGANFGTILLTGLIFGLFVWLFDYYLIAPMFFPWFLMINPLVPFIAHTFFFGATLAIYFIGFAGPQSRVS